MGLGNRNSKNGNKGSRFSYELGQLQVLNKILDAVSGNGIEIGDIILNTDNLENLLQGINGSEETPGVLIVSDAAGLAPGFFSVSFTNTGSVDATVLGATIKPGVTWEFEAKTGNRYGAFTYDATAVGAELTILTSKIV